ncbi:hypothetical protein [Pseudomonas umsongensis]|jgi:hypothetical protein|uniref:hypothetical protein n=1 Tax=Pseudomonas umsongensis TaxID=198618 RepID=UPI0015B798CD|nr:hypothetical protein [Pseudomonas umsongensis]
MTESAKHIKNPLTLISIFAGAAELSGVAILPLIENPNQEFYIHFLVFFPTFIIILFFATLNFNHRVLYAPSDYKDENNFVNPFGQASPEEVKRKLDDETREVQAEVKESELATLEQAKGEVTTLRTAVEQSDAPTEQKHVDPTEPASSKTYCAPSPENEAVTATSYDPVEDSDSPEPAAYDHHSNHQSNTTHQSSESDYKNMTQEAILKRIGRITAPYYDPKVAPLMEPYEIEHRNLMANVALTEKLAISKLSKALNIDFKADVTFQPHNSAVKYVFDAADYSSEVIQLVEVKLFNSRFDPNRFAETLIKAHNLSRTFKDKDIILHIVVVLGTSFATPSEVRNRMRDLIEEFKFNILVHVTTTADLENEGGRFY